MMTVINCFRLQNKKKYLLDFQIKVKKIKFHMQKYYVFDVHFETMHLQMSKKNKK